MVEEEFSGRKMIEDGDGDRQSVALIASRERPQRSAGGRLLPDKLPDIANVIVKIVIQ